jgi:hypothetical protein
MSSAAHPKHNKTNQNATTRMKDYRALRGDDLTGMGPPKHYKVETGRLQAGQPAEQLQRMLDERSGQGWEVDKLVAFPDGHDRFGYMILFKR